jgi:hypothetical protein
MLRIEAGSRQAKPLDRPPVQKMLVDDLVHIFEFDEAVPNRLGIDDNDGTMLALVETARLVGAYQVLQPRILDGVLKGGFEFLAALRQATGTGCVLIALVGADEEMMLKFRHWILPSRLRLFRLSPCDAQGFLRQW